MYITHSLIPHSMGRLTSRHTDMSGFGAQQHVPATTPANSKNIPDEWVYEGELLEKGYSFNTNARYRTTRVFTQQSTDFEFINENQRLSGKSDAIETYIRNAGLTGASQSYSENIIDVFA